MTRPDLRCVFYIDDDADIREVAVLALELIGGLEVHAFATGAEAIASPAHLTPDLLLLDVMMPDLDGPATLARLRHDTRFARIPAVFFTAKAHPSEIQRLLGLGAIAVIGKPFNAATLADDLRRIGGGVHDG